MSTCAIALLADGNVPLRYVKRGYPHLCLPLQTSYVAATAAITTKYPCKPRVERIPRCRPHGPTCPFFLAASRVSSFPIGHVDTKKGQVGPLRRDRHLGTGLRMKLRPRLRGTTGLAPPPPAPFDFAPGLRSLPNAKSKRVARLPPNYFLSRPLQSQKARDGFSKLVEEHPPRAGAVSDSMKYDKINSWNKNWSRILSC